MTKQLIGLIALVMTSSACWWSENRKDPREILARLRKDGPLNVVLITADTLGADVLGCYGNREIETPHLDQLAKSGILFENATTAAPLTLPAHTSIMTGSYPMSHGVLDNVGFYVKPNQVTLAGMLKAAGYATGAFVGAFVLDARWGLNQGFDRYVDDFDLSTAEVITQLAVGEALVSRSPSSPGSTFTTRTARMIRRSHIARDMGVDRGACIRARLRMWTPWSGNCWIRSTRTGSRSELSSRLSATTVKASADMARTVTASWSTMPRFTFR